MKNYKSEIILSDIQIKSLEKAKLLAECIRIIEEECCIGTTKITIQKSFICPEIDIDKLTDTKMELHLRDILLQLL